MSDDSVIDFAAERGKRIHDVHEKKLAEIRQAFAKALPMPKAKSPKKTKSKPKKR